jgi:hypothetical protein
MQSIAAADNDLSYLSSSDPSICRATEDDVSSANSPLRIMFSGFLRSGQSLRSGLADLFCCFFPYRFTFDIDCYCVGHQFICGDNLKENLLRDSYGEKQAASERHLALTDLPPMIINLASPDRPLLCFRGRPAKSQASINTCQAIQRQFQMADRLALFVDRAYSRQRADIDYTDEPLSFALVVIVWHLQIVDGVRKITEHATRWVPLGPAVQQGISGCPACFEFGVYRFLLSSWLVTLSFSICVWRPNGAGLFVYASCQIELHRMSLPRQHLDDRLLQLGAGVEWASADIPQVDVGRLEFLGGHQDVSQPITFPQIDSNLTPVVWKAEGEYPPLQVRFRTGLGRASGGELAEIEQLWGKLLNIVRFLFDVILRYVELEHGAEVVFFIQCSYLASLQVFHQLRSRKLQPASVTLYSNAGKCALGLAYCTQFSESRNSLYLNWSE